LRTTEADSLIVRQKSLSCIAQAKSLVLFYFLYVHEGTVVQKLAPLGGDIVAVSCHLLPFKIDRQTFSNAKGTNWNVIVGVLSLPSNAKRRKAIRETWAKDRPGVFFVVAGVWELISKEFSAFY